jgi:hypothetical protein
MKIETWLGDEGLVLKVEGEHGNHCFEIPCRDEKSAIRLESGLVLALAQFSTAKVDEEIADFSGEFREMREALKNVSNYAADCQERGFAMTTNALPLCKARAISARLEEL